MGRHTMPATNHDLHGNVPDTSATALLLVDVISDLEFDGGDVLLRRALPTARRIARLKQRARTAGVPAIYVNDNFGKWRSDFQSLVCHVTDDDVRGRPLGRLLAPDADDYFVLKPKHSGFYSTTLALLLEYLRAKTLVIVGYTATQCVLFTAIDAYMRDFHLSVPRDCVASADPTSDRAALRFMADFLKADTRPSTRLQLAAPEKAQGKDRRAA